VFPNSSLKLSVTGTLELTVANKRNPGYVSDHVRLAKQVKLRLSQLIYLGVTRPLAFGILVQGTSKDCHEQQ
jgi:hypothetical protein